MEAVAAGRLGAARGHAGAADSDDFRACRRRDEDGRQQRAGRGNDPAPPDAIGSHHAVPPVTRAERTDTPSGHHPGQWGRRGIVRKAPGRRSLPGPDGGSDGRESSPRGEGLSTNLLLAVGST